MSDANQTSNTPPRLPPHIGETDRVVLFDGVCRLCNASANFVIEHDKEHHFKLASVQSDEGQAILKHFDYPLTNFKTMLVVDGERCYQKSDAFFQVMKGLGYPWKLSVVLQLVPRFVRDWVYDRIALNRYRLFGKYDYCVLPGPDHEKRYLDGSRSSEKN